MKPPPPSLIRRRTLLSLLAGATALPAVGVAAAPVSRLGVAWRGPNAGDGHHVGVLAVDWAARSLRIAASVPVPTRPHGMLAEPDGGMLAVALRPGEWMVRIDADGRVVDRVDITQESLPRRFGGHVAASADGRLLYTTETDTTSGAGRIGVRDARTLRKVDDWASAGIEPHQLLIDSAGHVVLANGGIPRDADDRKQDLDRMNSSLVRVDGERGSLLDQWRLGDPRLSLRHLTWADDGLLGVALQAEHDRAEDRAAAPALAVWDGDTLRTVNGGDGYAGDITGVPGGGFVISHARRDIAWWWHPAAPERLAPVAQLQNAYALATGHYVLISAALGLARWHPHEPPAMLPWPRPMALDNHMVTLRS